MTGYLPTYYKFVTNEYVGCDNVGSAGQVEPTRLICVGAPPLPALVSCKYMKSVQHAPTSPIMSGVSEDCYDNDTCVTLPSQGAKRSWGKMCRQLGKGQKCCSSSMFLGEVHRKLLCIL